jgi:beta-N-acetylhexosaminidase
MIEQLIGSRLVFGIPGTKITPEIVRHFQETHCGGLILYRINFESPDQIRKLINDLENALERRLLVCCDHEGGRVIMFGGGVTVFPSSQAFGITGNTAYARSQGEFEARELRRLGIDVNFAPVLDVLTETFSPNIGIRAYGRDADLVARMGAARISGMQGGGLSACAKHFPGLGQAPVDAHLTLPTLPTTWEEMLKIHLVPFMLAMKAGVDGIMTSHPLYPNLDSAPETPITFSRKLVRDFLRNETGYKGVIFSDDLEMGAVRELCPIGEAAVRSADAGHDMILSCHDMKAQKEVYRALVDAYGSKRLEHGDLEESAARIKKLQSRRKDRFAPLPEPALVQKENEEARALVREICEHSVTALSSEPSPRQFVSRGPSKKEILIHGSPTTTSGMTQAKTTCVIFPHLYDLSDKIMIEKEFSGEAALLAGRCRALGLEPSVKIVSIETSDPEISEAQELSSKSGQTLLFIYDAHLFPAQKRLLDAVQSAANNLAVVLLRDVYDAEYVKEGATVVTNYGFRLCDIDAVLWKLFVVK